MTAVIEQMLATSEQQSAKRISDALTKRNDVYELMCQREINRRELAKFLTPKRRVP